MTDISTLNTPHPTHMPTHLKNLALPLEPSSKLWTRTRVVDGGVTATGVLSRERGNLITISSTL